MEGRGVLNKLSDSDIDLSDIDEEEITNTTMLPAINEKVIYSEKEDSDLEDEEEREENIDPNVGRQLIWKRTDVSFRSLREISPAPETSGTELWDEISYFSEYFDEDLFELITKETNRMYLSTNGTALSCTVTEMKQWFGISILMSCVQYPNMRMYWQNEWRVPVIADNMSRNRFFVLRKSIKVIYDPDISEDTKKNDKIWRVRPFVDRIAAGCMKQKREANVSVDEMIMPFTGVCGIKQYIRGKPNPEGLKAFVLANPNGVVCDFIIYQGKTTFPLEYNQYGLGEAAVMYLTRNVPPGHCVYYDRYFNTVSLCENLLNRGLGAVGTIMVNRLPKSVRLSSDKNMKKSGRGTSEQLVRSDEKIAVVKWMDNKSVVMLSNCVGVQPEDVVQRWCKKQKKYVEVKRPHVIQKYNQFMGGVDMADRLAAYCPMRFRTRKWTLRTIQHLTDLAINNSWLKYQNNMKESHVPRKEIKQLRAFKMVIGEKLILSIRQRTSDTESSDEELPPAKKAKYTIVPPEYKRSKNAHHMPIFDDSKTYHRCRRSGCKMFSRIKCTTCNVFLCLTSNRNCFANFHTP